MKRITFVNPPIHLHDLSDIAPPLGLMVLSAVARQEGWSPTIVDLSLPAPDETFYERAVETILDTNPTVVGFTSMCVNTHVALLLAKELREREPDLVLVAGGVHFGSIALQCHEHFPWLDSIVVGEGETALKQLLGGLGAREALPRIVQGVSEQFAHPHSAYELVDHAQYASANPRRLVLYEGARGCIFKCSFCYSPSQFHDVRELLPDRICTDWVGLADRGYRHVFAVQDNFTNYPARAQSVCEAIAAEDLPLTWNGYATLPQLSSDLVACMARSKCTGLYLGVDAVSAGQQITLNKRFFRGESHLRDRLQMIVDAGIDPTCAFMVDLFDYRAEELEHVLQLATMCAAMGVRIRINSLTRYPGSAVGGSPHQSRYSEHKVRTLLDVPEVVRKNPLAENWPALFPFHSCETDVDAWSNRLHLLRVAQSLLPTYAADIHSRGEADGTWLVEAFSELAAMARCVDRVPEEDWHERLAHLVEMY